MQAESLDENPVFEKFKNLSPEEQKQIIDLTCDLITHQFEPQQTRAVQV